MNWLVSGFSSKFDSDKISQVIKVTGCVVICCISCNYIYKKILNIQEKHALDKIRQKRKSEREDQISKIKSRFANITKDKEGEYAEISKWTLKELQEKLFKRELLAENVLESCIWMSINSQDEFNCITEFITGAKEKAVELDKMSMVKGPLHGIPFCIKEDIAVAGYEYDCKCTRRLVYNPSVNTATIVQSLENLGAIAFCRTNGPQTCVSFGSFNTVFGKSLRHRSLGGSSSGTACLVAAGGCLFGTGTDLRLQTHFSGLCTLNPTSSRLSRRGCTRCCDSCYLPSVPGVLTKTAEDQALIFQALLDHNLQNKLDASTVPLTWNSQVFESKQSLRIGYITGFPSFPPIGDTHFLISRVQSFLQSAGHVLVPFEIPPDVSVDLPFNSNIKQISYSIKDAIPYRKEGFLVGWMKMLQNCLQSNAKPTELSTREDLMHAFLDKMQKEQIDVIICPVFPFPAINVELVPMLEEIAPYTLLWSWLDFPVGVVKFWTESGLYWKPHVELLDKPQGWKTELLKYTEHVVGKAIGVQVIGRPYQEELVLKMMVELDDINK